MGESKSAVRDEVEVAWYPLRGEISEEDKERVEDFFEDKYSQTVAS